MTVSIRERMCHSLFFFFSRKVEWLSCRSDGNESLHAECHTNECIPSVASSAISFCYVAIFLLALQLVFTPSRTEQRRLSGLVTNEGKSWRDLSCTRVKGVCRPAISHNLWFFFAAGSIFEAPRVRWLRRAMWRSSYQSLPASGRSRDRNDA